MIAFAEHHFRLWRRDEKQHTEREKLEGLIKRSRNPTKREALEAQLAGPPPPAGAMTIWNRFIDLSSGRGGGFGPAHISWMDIAAWQSLRRIRLSGWELDLIRDLDRAYLRITGEYG